MPLKGEGSGSELLGLNTVLDELKRTGQAESSGVFTITAGKALEKLRRFALPEPRLYVLNLLASAVIGGATRFVVHLESSKATFEDNGAPLDADQFKDLWNQLLNPVDRRVYELAVALNALRTLGPTELFVESWNGERGWNLLVDDESLEVLEIRESSFPIGTAVNRLTVREPLRVGTIRRWWGQLPEHAALVRTAAYAPLRMEVNRKPISHSVTLGILSATCVAWVHLVQELPKLRVEVPERQWSPMVVVFPQSHSPGRFEVVLCLDVPSAAGMEGLLILLNGVAFLRSQVVFHLPFACAVVLTGDLSKNLSHTDLAEDDRYRSMLAHLNDQADDLLVSRLDDTGGLGPEFDEGSAHWVPDLCARLRERKLDGSAAKVERWLKERQFAQDLENPDLWGALRTELESLATDPAGKKLETRLLGALSEAGRSFFEAGKTLRCCRLWVRLVELGQIRDAAWYGEQWENLVVLRALCGMEHDPTECRSPETVGALFRLSGRPTQALQWHQCSQSRGESLLALERFDEAETSLREAVEKVGGPAAAESLSDCLAFGPGRTPQRRKDALKLREEAVAQRTLTWASCQTFFLEDLAHLAKGALPFHDWIRYRIRAGLGSSIPIEAVRQLDAGLTAGRALLRRGATGIVRIKSTVIAAESKFAPNHVLLDAAQQRAAHLLRGAGHWAEADDVLARGRLLRGIRLLSLQEDRHNEGRESKQPED